MSHDHFCYLILRYSTKVPGTAVKAISTAAFHHEVAPTLPEVPPQTTQATHVVQISRGRKQENPQTIRPMGQHPWVSHAQPTELRRCCVRQTSFLSYTTEILHAMTSFCGEACPSTKYSMLSTSELSAEAERTLTMIAEGSPLGETCGYST